MKFGPVTPKLTELISERQVRHRQKMAYFVEYLRIYWTVFAIFSPYEIALRADDGSVRYFSICKGTLPWQLNNVAAMKAFFARSPDGSTVLFRYLRRRAGYTLGFATHF